ncbi:MAG: hypothetical protein LUG91_10920 [Ruminococcus sp.]|nr:hypothetical protein [Ruminococcus sp.]
MSKINITNFKWGEYHSYNGTWALCKCNSAGGVDIGFDVQNSPSSTKTIKYITIYFTPYNAVGDVVGCTARNQSTIGLTITGPISPGKSENGCLGDNMWWNYSIRSISISHAVVQYMDGSEEKLTGSDIGTSYEFNGCYVATAIYGSYDCPQVWTLRRYRDNTLAKTWYGRVFVRTYYAISPTLVKWFGDTAWFQRLWRGKLDRLVAKLQSDGVASTPYEDQEW